MSPDHWPRQEAAWSLVQDWEAGCWPRRDMDGGWPRGASGEAGSLCPRASEGGRPLGAMTP